MNADEMLWPLLRDFLAAERLELDDVELRGQGGSRVLRVTVDGESIDLELLAELSPPISRIADEVLDGPYNLEVSSAGLERRLRRPAQFRKSVGRQISVKTKADVDGRRRHDGVLEVADEDGFVVVANGEKRRIGYDQIKSARTVFAWERSPKPGKQGHRA